MVSNSRFLDNFLYLSGGICWHFIYFTFPFTFHLHLIQEFQITFSFFSVGGWGGIPLTSLETEEHLASLFDLDDEDDDLDH